MEILFVTGNKHKLEEAKFVLAKYGIAVKQLNEEKFEHKDMSLEEVSRYNAEKFFEKYKLPVMVDDTGVFFEKYNNFPGNHPKMIFNMLGYKGLLKLTKDESKKAYFKTVIAYKDKKTSKIFEGILNCTISEIVHDKDADVMPYERILLVDGKPLSSMTRPQKNKISHRAKAFNKLGEFLSK